MGGRCHSRLYDGQNQQRTKARRLRWPVAAIALWCWSWLGAADTYWEGLADALARPGAVSEEFRQELAQFYARRGYTPLWFERQWPSARSAELLPVLAAAAEEGLDPADYAIDDLYRFCHLRAVEAIECELRFSDTLLRYARDVGYGFLRTTDADPNWHIPQQRLPARQLLAEVASTTDLTAVLERLPPPHVAYRQLRTALAEYRSAMAGVRWTAIPEGPSLRPGARGARVAGLRERLAFEYPELMATADTERFDASLAAAVRDFQGRHGLDQDGIVGNQTRSAINILPAERLIQIRLNMERWRWLPRDLGADHILVNLAGFDLTLTQGGQPQLHLRAISGRTDRTSPAFQSKISRLVLNPDWTVPRRLAIEDMLPQLQRDPLALKKKKIRILLPKNGRLIEIDPTRINWRSYNEDHFPFLLRQTPGPHNSLGRIKFVMPNPFNVFLHDTPARALFFKAERTLSSGCIRVDRPLQLAARLLGGDPEFAQQSLLQRIQQGDTQDLPINPAVPVYLAYLTAWVDEKGVLQFRNDVYSRNVQLRDWFSLQ